MALDVDVAIVGAGVIGCAIAERLSHRAVSVCVIERNDDVASETSKSNTGLADSGWECEPGSLEAALVRRTSLQWEEVCDRLDVPFRRCGALSVARSDADEAALEGAIRHAEANGVPVRRLSGDEARKLAPYLSEEARAAIDVPEEGIIDPIRLTLGYAEIAARNGVRFLFSEPLVAAERGGRRVIELRTPRTTLRPRFVVNAAGLGADLVSRLIGAESFDVWPRRGEYLLLDREAGREITRPITQIPTGHTRGVMVVPATHGSVLLGPTADDDRDKSDRSTHASTLDRVFEECRSLVPGIRRDQVITSFAGLRPASDRTYRVELSDEVDNLVQACGIRSTGISGSYAIAERVVELLDDAGLGGGQRARSVWRVPRRLRLRDADPAELAAHPLGRTVVCACEKVTALEIHDALSSPPPARSIAGIARRTHASWGRCQGAACLSGISFIASMYLPGKAWQTPQTRAGGTLGVGEHRG